MKKGLSERRPQTQATEASQFSLSGSLSWKSEGRRWLTSRAARAAAKCGQRGHWNRNFGLNLWNRGGRVATTSRGARAGVLCHPRERATAGTASHDGLSPHTAWRDCRAVPPLESLESWRPRGLVMDLEADGPTARNRHLRLGRLSKMPCWAHHTAAEECHTSGQASATTRLPSGSSTRTPCRRRKATTKASNAHFRQARCLEDKS